jgi:hypothetical protein
VSAARVAEIFRGDATLMAMLAAVERLGLPDCWIAAGAVRSAVWDILHGWPIRHDWADVDVLFFDAADTSKTREAEAEATLGADMPGIPWEVRNQARMHLKTGLPPYRDTLDGLRNFAETPTATGVRLNRGEIEVIAPHGVDDLFACTVRPVFDDPHIMGFYRARMEAKRWPDRWPQVRVVGL